MIDRWVVLVPGTGAFHASRAAAEAEAKKRAMDNNGSAVYVAEIKTRVTRAPEVAYYDRDTEAP